MSSKIPSDYLPHIDGLRAIAVLSVIGYHFFPSWVPGGFVGVDVFFVLSGYLITGILLRDLDANRFSANRFSIADFYQRRVRRIFPALALVLALCCAFGWMALLANEYEQLGKHIVASTAFVQNLVLWSEAGYFDQGAIEKPLLHLWSLGVEEQFYLLWPLLIWAGWKLHPKRRLNSLLTLTAAVTLISFIAGLYALNLEFSAAYYLPWNRLWELSAGALLAAVLMRYPHLPEQIPKLSHHLLSLTGIALLFASFIVIHDQRAFPGYWALMPVVATLLLVFSGGHKNLANRGLCLPLLVGIGLISYPLYLWHWPLLSFANLVLGERPSIPLRVGLIFLALTLAWVTWRWVERPFRFGRLRTQSTPGLIMALFLVGSFGGYVWLSQGVIERPSVRALSFMTQDLVFELPEDHSSWCAAQSQWASDATCFLQESTTHPTSALIGDSHAQALFPGLATVLEEQGENLLLVGAAGCPPLLDVYSSDTSKSDQRLCLERMTPAIEAVVKDTSINRVYLTGRGPLYAFGEGFGSYRDSYDGDWTLRFISENAGDLKNPEAYQAGLRLTVKTLLEAGKNVVFLHDVPELGFDPRTCMPDRPFALAGSQHWPCGVEKAVFLNRYANFEQLVEEVLEDFPRVTQVHLSEALCDDTFCTGALPDMLLYRDDDHLSERGSHWVIRRLQDSGVL